MQKVNSHDFQVANQEILFGNVYMIQNSWQNFFTLFYRNSCLTIKLSTGMQYSEAAVIQTWSQSRNEINTHTEHLVNLKDTTISFNQKEAIWSILNKEKRKQGNKKEKLTELLHLTVKIASSNDNMTLILETSHTQYHCGNHKAVLNEKLTDSPRWFYIHSSI